MIQMEAPPSGIRNTNQNMVVFRNPELEFLNNLWGLGTE
jgi:hypothetical protein